MADSDNTQRIAVLELDDRSVIRRTPEIDHERRVAIADLLESNSFSPAGMPGGPYEVALGVEENRVRLSVKSVQGTPLGDIVIPVSPLRKVIKDYFLICESYFDAVKSGMPQKVEALDMGRRGIHNEGSEILQVLLAEKAKLNFETARRLFTLICVLHVK